MSDFIVNIDETNAAQLLIEESHKRPVVVDFWADWCEPCKVLMPLLEKIANEYQGAFLLAKVNADEQQGITQQFGVRSLPTVMVIQNGQPVTIQQVFQRFFAHDAVGTGRKSRCGHNAHGTCQDKNSYIALNVGFQHDVLLYLAISQTSPKIAQDPMSWP